MPGLVGLQSAVLLAPSKVRLLRHADLFARMDDGPTLGNQHIRLTKLDDILLRLESLPAHHLSSMIQARILTQDLDQFAGERSLAAYPGRTIRMVCDNARYHHTKAVKAFLAGHADQLKIFWLPPYCPSLNLIERLWGHLKRTILANVLFVSVDDLVEAFRRGVGRINGHRNQMGFMFDHDEVHKKAA